MKGDVNVMQQDPRRPTPSLSGRHTGPWVLAVLVTLAGGGMTGTSAQSPGTPTLSGSWTLQESTGDLPDQAGRAFDGSAVSTATIEIKEAGGSVGGETPNSGLRPRGIARSQRRPGRVGCDGWRLKKI